MVFCQNVLIPVSMDTLSVSGAGATIFSAQAISSGVGVPIHIVGLLPTIVNRRYAMTTVVMQMIEQLSQTYKIPVLPAIRTDQVVGRSARMHKMIADLDPKAKVLEDYAVAASSLLRLFRPEAVPAAGAA
jgi:cellulose biosynthesis protein BcsQ